MRFLEETLFHSFYIHKRYLSLYRFLYCLIILLFIGLPSYTWLTNEFNYVFAPPKLSLANFFTGFPSRAFFIGVSFLNVASFFLMFWGWRTRLFSILFTLTCIFGNSFVFSFGKIDHGILWIIVPLIMSFTDWGRYYSIDSMGVSKSLPAGESPEEKERIAYILAIFALLIGFSMFTAGVLKVYGGWWKWSALGVKNNLYRHYYFLGRDKYLAGDFLRINNHLFWKGMDYATLVFEIGFLAAAVRLRLFRWFAAIAAVFHLGVLLMFNISFITNLLVYLLFIDWQSLEAFVHRLFKHTRLSIAKLKVALFALSVPVLVYWLWMLFAGRRVFNFDSVVNALLNALRVPGADRMARDSLFLFLIPFLLVVLVARLKYKSKPVAT